MAKVNVKVKTLGEVKDLLLKKVKEQLGDQRFGFYVDSVIESESKSVVRSYLWAALGLEHSFGEWKFRSDHHLSKDQLELRSRITRRIEPLVDAWIDAAIKNVPHKDVDDKKIASAYRSAFNDAYKHALHERILNRAQEDALRLASEVVDRLEVEISGEEAAPPSDSSVDSE